MDDEVNALAAVLELGSSASDSEPGSCVLGTHLLCIVVNIDSLSCLCTMNYLLK